MPMRRMSAQSALVMVVIPIYALGCNVTRNSLAVAVPRAPENAVFCAVVCRVRKKKGRGPPGKPVAPPKLHAVQVAKAVLVSTARNRAP